MQVLFKTPEQLIVEEIKRKNKSIQWLAVQVCINYRHLYYVLTGKPGEKRKLSAGLKARIEEVLDKEFPKVTNEG